jgi:hypothetical protein
VSDFIRFTQTDPNYGPNPTEVVVNVGQIVKIVPVWYEVGADGERYLAYEPKDDAAALERLRQKEYEIYDSIGGKYPSEHTTPEGRALIETIWRNAK